MEKHVSCIFLQPVKQRLLHWCLNQSFFTITLGQSSAERQSGKCDVMHLFHVHFQWVPLSISFVAKVTLELANRRFHCDVMISLLVALQFFFPSESFSALVALELAIVFQFALLSLPWMVCLVVGVQLFHATVVTLADLTDEIFRCHLKKRSVVVIKMERNRTILLSI